jgi:hypothetical protein
LAEIALNPDVTGKTPRQIREWLTGLVMKDLYGPFDGETEEVDESRVSDRYLVGMLAPPKQEVPAETDDELAQGGKDSSDEGSAESSKAPTATTFPSSMGLTFTVIEEVESLKVEASWGRYERVDSEFLETKKGAPKKVWKRFPEKGSAPSLALIDGDLTPIVLNTDFPDITLQGRIRKRDVGWVVTLFLVNGQEEADRLKDEKWIFQPRLTVEAVDGAPVFIRRPTRHDPDRMDENTYREVTEMAMLYRRDLEFAVGHGVAVHAETLEGNPWRAMKLETSVAPQFEVAMQLPPTKNDKGFEELDGLELDMEVLSNLPTEKLVENLTLLTTAYESWVEAEKARLADPEEHLGEHVDAVGRALDKCQRVLERIRDGIRLLGENEQAAEAFRFANRAMWLQRIHTIFAEGVRREEKKGLADIHKDPKNHSWYPFQLAFILLNLPSTTLLDHPDRSHESDAIVDLLWFPTGGGKTEAYLGLAAYTLGLRRMEGEIEGHDGEKGVAVIMRYTLRLLTLQQFQRASALICACETIRREHPEKLGETPFRLGLWVGGKATPNWTSISAEAIAEARGAGGHNIGGASTPAQLKNCPWCGSPIMAARDILVEPIGSGRGRTITYCGDNNGRCSFSPKKSPGEGLPVVVVDEEIYRLLPSMIIATVDKFAQMPWDGRTQMLFGRVDGYCPRHGFRSSEVEDRDSHNKSGDLLAVSTQPHIPLRPPDLIIQDELHLISGPLGSLTGLYETAIDEMCAWTVNGKRVRPKVIASTATIRNAMAQVNSLFLRRVEIFPTPGTSITDNFFSVRRGPDNDFPGRLYLGICAPGKRLKAVLIRVYVAFMSAAQKIYNELGKDAIDVDPWMTTIGYFNSLRELGGMRRLLDDDVRTRLRGMDQRGLAGRRVRKVEELTSRKSSIDIPDILDRLEVTFDPAVEKKREEAQKKKKRFNKPVPFDAVLATNMVSVGVDVGRLGLMVAAGQPKATAEYIQATSRVGRRHPGIVCTVYNWARPRDLSHYERFEHYHATFYERVESLSVTPFAERAMDRGLSALFVSLVRLPGKNLNANEKAEDVDDKHAYVLRAIDIIGQRAASISGESAFGDRVKADLKARLDEWLYRAQAGGTRLGYKRVKDGTTLGLLSYPSSAKWDTFTCLNSLRDVEPTSGFILIDDGIRSRASDVVGGPDE